MQKKLKKVAVTIGFKADNTPIKKAFYGRSTAQAKSRAERWLESHGTPEKQADILTLGGWAARWLNVYKKPDVTPTAYTTTYEITVRRHILPALGSCVMMDLTPMDIKAFYNSVSHLSKSVCSKIKMCLNGILETAVENGLCEHNPARSASSSNAASSLKSASRKERCSGVRAGFAAFIACSLSACAGKIGNLAPVGAACSVTGTMGIAWGCHTT